MKIVILLFIFSIIYLSCSPTGSVPPERPSKPSMVKRIPSSDLAEVEMGIDAYASPTDDIVVMWYKHPETLNLDKYLLYRGEERSGQVIFSNIQDIAANSNLDTIYVDEGLNIGTRYYYFIIASDQNNSKSVSSDTVNYQLLEKPVLTNLEDGQTLENPTSLKFEAMFTPGPPAGSILRIVEPGGSRRLVYLEYKNYLDDYGSGSAFHELGQDTLKKYFENNVLYDWRIDLTSSEIFTGSESEWQEFSINWGN